jgi:hypothetical protein
MGALFSAAEFLYEFGRLLYLDDINDYDRWVYDLADGRIHHGLVGFLLQRLAFLLGMAALFYEANDETSRT